MRNLKKLFAVLLTVAMIASLTVPALAANTYESEALKLQQIKVFDGVPEDLTLTSKLTRLQGLIFSIRASGKDAAARAMTDAEVDEVIADVTDDIPVWANRLAEKYVAYAIKYGYTKGVNAAVLPKVEFAANADIAGAEFLVFLLRVMGYTDADTADADLADQVVNAGLVSVSGAATFIPKTPLMRDDAAGILYGTFMDGQNEDGTYLIDAYIASGATTLEAAIGAGFKDELDAISVKAIGARKLQATFNAAIDKDKAKFEVKRGTVKPSVKSIKFAEDNKSAVIEFNTDMIAGDYTVTASGIANEDLVATVKVEAAKLTTIRFLSDVAVKDGNNITVNVVAENQYGDDITSKLTSANVTASNGKNPSINKDGVLKIEGDNNETFKVDANVVVTIVDSATATVATKTLKVAKAIDVESIEFGVLTTDDKDLKGKEINIGTFRDSDVYDEYYLPITVKDQYGNVLKANQLAGFQLISSNNKIINIDKVNDTDDGTVIKFKETEGDGASGAVVITAIATGTGKTASITITVKDNPKIDVVTLVAPEAELRQTVAAVLPLEILDTYGVEIKLDKDADVAIVANNEIKIDGDTKLTATGATFEKEIDYVKDQTIIKIVPTDKNIVLTVVTATGKYQSMTLTASDEPEVTSIKGLDKDFATMLVKDGSSVLLKTDLAEKVLFLDQYGEELDTDDAPIFVAKGANAPNDFYYNIKDSDDVLVADQIFDASGDIGSEKYVITLYDKDDEELDSIEFTITIVEAKKVTTFGIEDLEKFYTGSEAGYTQKQTVEIYGMLNGKKVVVPQEWIKHVSASNGLVIGTDGVFNIPSPAIDTDGKDKSSVLTILIDNTDTTITATKQVTFSNAAPRAQSVVVKYDDKEVEADTLQVPDEELVTGMDIVGGNSKLQIIAKDQYGEEIADYFQFVITNNNTSAANFAISSTGLISNGIISGNAGKSLQLSVVIDNMMKSIKIVVE